MSVEIALIAGSTVAGVISATVLEKWSKARSTDEACRSPQKPSPNAIRTELVSLLFEKTLASEAITRVYEASQESRIDRLERDRLLVKYKEQLDSLNRKIALLQPAAEYADLTEVRHTLATLLQDRIAAVDQKLRELSKSGVSFDSPLDTKVQDIIAETSRIESEPSAEQTPRYEEKNISQLQDEIIQALDRLEQVEMDKE
jgi:hypothetical protein